MKTRKFAAIVRAAGVCLAVNPLLISQTEILVGGRALDVDARSPAPGLGISLARLPDSGTKAPSVTYVTSQKDGTFTARVAPAKYRLCVDGGLVYLDPCQWLAGTTDVDFSRTSSIDLQVRRGVQLSVQLYDPTEAAVTARSAKAGAAVSPGPPLAVSVADQFGAIRPLLYAGSIGSVSTFSLLVPPQRIFTVKVSSAFLELTDDKGNSLPQNTYTASVASPDVGPANTLVLPFSPFSRPHLLSKVVTVTVKGLLSP